MQSSDSTTGAPRRAITLMLITVIALAFIGYFVGLDYGVPHSTVRPDENAEAGTAGPHQILPSMSYSDIRRAPLGPTRQRTSSIRTLLDTRSIPKEGFVPNPVEKRESLGLRSERRAYNGAPPIIPHEVDQLSTESCLICHGSGFKLANRTAKQLPHPYYENCLQCHAPTAPAWMCGGALAENSFDGVAAPFEGARAWMGAPPVIPHSTWMRDNCIACHGPTGWRGMETTHPWRENCLQCHAPSAALDLRPGPQGVEFLPFAPRLAPPAGDGN